MPHVGNGYDMVALTTSPSQTSPVEFQVSSMEARTRRLLDQLAECNLFASVGSSLDDSTVRAVRNWSEAIDSCSAQKWEDVTLKARNMLTIALSRSWKEQNRNWNERTAEVKSRLEPIVESRIAGMSATEESLKIVQQCIRWDLLGPAWSRNTQSLSHRVS